MQECLYLLESHHLMSASCSILDSERRLSRVALIFFFQTLFIRFPSQKTPTAFFFSTTSTTSIQRLSIQAIDFNPPSLFFEPLPIAKAPFFFATNNPPKKTTTTESSVWNLLFFLLQQHHSPWETLRVVLLAVKTALEVRCWALDMLSNDPPN